MRHYFVQFDTYLSMLSMAASKAKQQVTVKSLEKYNGFEMEILEKFIESRSPSKFLFSLIWLRRAEFWIVFKTNHFLMGTKMVQAITSNNNNFKITKSDPLY